MRIILYLFLLVSANMLLAQVPADGKYYSSQDIISKVIITNSKANSFSAQWFRTDLTRTQVFDFKPYKNSTTKYVAYDQNEIVSMLVLSGDQIIEHDIQEGYITSAFIITSKKNAYDVTKLEKAYALLGTTIEKNSASYPFQEQNQGQMFFSNKPIILGQEKTTDFIQTYNLGDPLYMSCYFSTSVKGLLLKNGYGFKNAEYEYKFVFSLDGKDLERAVFSDIDPKSAHVAVAISNTLFTPEEKLETEFNNLFNQILLQDLSTGKHELKCRLKIYTGTTTPNIDEFCLGKIQMNVTDQNYVKAIKSGPFVQPKPGKLNLEYKEKAYAAADKEFKKTIKTYYSAIVVSDDWTIKRHYETGVLVGRDLEAVVYFETHSGECFEQTYFFRQPLDANGYSDQLLFSYRDLESKRFYPCKAVPIDRK